MFKICKIQLVDYQQFQNTTLDFTHPETGEPLDKICFIGRNGTGKSTILRLLKDLIFKSQLKLTDTSIAQIEVESDGRRLIYFPTIQGRLWVEKRHLKEKIGEIGDMNQLKSNEKAIKIFNEKLNNIESYARVVAIEERTRFTEPAPCSIAIFSPAESAQNGYLQIQDVPKTTLNEALEFFKQKDLQPNHVVSAENVAEFWKILIYHIKKREEERNEFENLSANLDKPKRQLIEEFDRINPQILDKLGNLWNQILDRAGLELDLANIRRPVQLSENLHAYIRSKTTKKHIAYEQLSTGIRNFMFRLGHIYALYFNRTIESGILLVDEPENSLFPDFLMDLLDMYTEITTDKNGVNNTQMFFATHNPIIAAQFEPYERVILEWNTEGGISARKGSAPLGDDPNDLLQKDFELKYLMGKRGREKWEELINLKKQLLRATTTEDKFQLADSISKIATDYNFIQ